MAVDDNKYDTGDLQDLELEDLDDTSLSHHPHHHNTTIYHQQAGYYDDIYDAPLCVPQDSLDGLDWYPNFLDDFISLGESGSCFLNEEYSGDSSRSNDASTLGYNQRVLLKERSSSSNMTNPSNGGLEDYFSAKGDTTLIEAPVTPIQMDEDDKRLALRECNYSTNSNISGNRVFGHKKKPRQNKRRRGLSWSENQVPGNFLDGGDKKRKCSHCLTERTPQWRMGPLGPKTLCNACGVRHKSGRLLPEYRPAASPTFDVGKHSNFHRKILKRKGISAAY